MKSTVKRQKAVKGFLPTTYAVFCGEYLLKIFTDQKQADKFARDYDDPRGIKSIQSEEIRELQNAAYSRYYHYATRPNGNWKPGMTFPELEDATNKLNAINDMILQRNAE